METVSRLTQQFVPTHYELSIDIDRPGRTFSGTVTMHGDSTRGSEHITVHAKDLVIHSATLDGHEADFAASDNDELSITTPDFKAAGHVVVISYSGEITDPMHGLYPCYYEHDGVKKELLATQFESHHAREVFPCIDEPEAKATFDVTLMTEQDITVLGNMPVKLQRPENDKLLTIFEKSPRMSTYLLAFVTGELHRKTATTKADVEVNVWATPVQPATSLDFALDSTVRTIEFYNEYFGTPYPLPKCDLVALPDFSVGAMENWGLITFREVALLADPKTTSISTRQYVALVVAHELAHQWFGNLVTMKWWNNLWLNESFATLMEYLAVDALHPEWNMWLEFASNEPITSLRRDSIDGVQPVQVDVNHPDEIGTLFDGAIVYAKGARLLRMLQNYVGNDAFRAGLKQYFRDFTYKNTEADDLWEVMAVASGKDIVGIMNTWISQSGFPLVRVSQDGDQVTLTQERFFVGPHEPSDQLWPIPLNSSDHDMPEQLDTKSVTVTRNNSLPLLFNVGDTAHFITYYDDALFQEITDELKANRLSPVDRVQLLNQAVLLVRGGALKSDHLIPFVTAFQNETSEPVWGLMVLALGELRKFVDDNPEAEKKLRQLYGQLAQTEYVRLGWEPKPDESEEDSKLRSIIVGMMIYSEDKDAIATARNYYDTTKLEDLNPELRPLILSSVARYGDAKIVDDLLTAYKSTSSSEVQNDISAGVTGTRIAEKISELLETIKDNDIVRPQDATRWFIYLMRGRDGRTVAWQWIRDNWQWVEDTFKSDKSYDNFPRYTATLLLTQQELGEYKAFFEPKKSIPALSRVITMGISEIEGRVQLIERDRAAVQKALLEL